MNRSPKRDLNIELSFKQCARMIVWKDRDRRKMGAKVDTAGAIYRALIQAYEKRFLHGVDPSFGAQQEATKKPRWVQILPRPRNAFWTICMGVLGTKGKKKDGYSIVSRSAQGKTKWYMKTSRDEEYLAGPRTIEPLIRLQYLEFSGQLTCLRITPLGEEVWSEFILAGGWHPDDLQPNLTP